MTQDNRVSARPILSRKLLFHILSAAIVACPSLHATAQPKNKVIATIPVGTGPAAIVINQKDTAVYVGNEMANTVSKIDTATKTVVATWSAGSTPAGLAITPNGKQLYVANAVNPGTVTILNASTGKLLKTISVDAFPNLLQVSPNGAFAYVPCITGNVYVIDTATKKVTSTISIGTNASSVAFTPDSTLAYVTDPADQLVAVIDTATNTITHSLSTSAVSWFAAVDPAATDEVFVLNGFDVPNTSQSVTIIENFTVYTAIGLASGEVGVFALTPNGQYAYVPQTYNSSGAAYNYLEMISTSSGQVVGKAVEVGNEPFAVAMANNGKHAYVSNTQDNTVSVLAIVPAQ